VRLIPDSTRRFSRRPHYDDWELDQIFEDIIVGFLSERHGKATFPISTDELTVLIDRRTDDLDTLADLSTLGEDVEGVTDFRPNKKPRVRIASQLWDGSNRENRLRTTLAHEFGHVHLHNHLFQMDGTLELFARNGGGEQQCRRDGIEGRGRIDWMEWQAGYASGAILMPATTLRAIIASTSIEVREGPVETASLDGQKLIGAVASAFQVSRDAARVRLSQARYIADDPQRRLET
jgi:hypothetical protein